MRENKRERALAIMALENLPPRNKSQRLIEKKQKQQLEEKYHRQSQKHHVKTIANPQISDICLGLNELTDSLHALPQDIISYFTLLKEIEAKCVYTVPHLQAYIRRFLTMRKNHPKRALLLSRIRDCIREIMPCLEEKMHVATIASDHVRKYVNKLDQAYDIIVDKEIPEIVRIGPLWEPCMKVSEPKSLQQQRSESRREALAAKKAKSGSAFEDDYDGTAAEDSSGPSKKTQRSSKKESKSNSSASGAANLSSKKRKNGSAADDDYSYNKQNGNTSHSQVGSGTSVSVHNSKKSKTSKVKKETKRENENGSQGSRNGNYSVGHAKSSNSRNGGMSNNGSNSNSNTVSNNVSSSRSAGSGGSKSKNGNYSDSGHISRAKKETQHKSATTPTSPVNYEGEPVYCYCQQVSYGEMVGCDGAHCEKEWFHLPCTGLKELPKGEWYCDECKAKMAV